MSAYHTPKRSDSETDGGRAASLPPVHPTRQKIRDLGRLLSAKNKLSSVEDLVPTARGINADIKLAMAKLLTDISKLEGLP